MKMRGVTLDISGKGGGEEEGRKVGGEEKVEIFNKKKSHSRRGRGPVSGVAGVRQKGKIRG